MKAMPADRRKIPARATKRNAPGLPLRTEVGPGALPGSRRTGARLGFRFRGRSLADVGTGNADGVRRARILPSILGPGLDGKVKGGASIQL